MQIAVLPFNAGPDTRPELARQFANFIVEIAQNHTENNISAANYMAQVEENGIPKLALINPSDKLNEPDMIRQMKGQAEFDKLVEGLLQEKGGGGTLTIRAWGDDLSEPERVEEFSYMPGAVFAALRGGIEMLAQVAGGALPESLSDEDIFGTKDQEAFLKFVTGYDALRYVEQAQGNVVSQFDPAPAMDLLLEAYEADREWEGPFLVVLQLCRICLGYRVGNPQKIETILKTLTEQEPKDSRAWFALGEFYEAAGNPQAASEAFEKAANLAPDEPAIWHRLARAQLMMGMPVNAERNLRKAAEMEGEEKASLDLLSDVLAQTGRVHEVPELWKQVMAENPTSAKAHARYAMSLLANNRRDEAIKTFEDALESLDDNTAIKRAYAPILAQDESEIDRAMDFYEDVIDENPTDHALLWEYAQTVARAGREFEVPETLRTILGSNPDPNLAANATAWLIEIEQPKRVEVVKAASEKAEKGDYEAAIKDLKPLRQWLGDYWKLWMVMASCYNQLEDFVEAEQCARRVLEMFPTCEPAFVELNNALLGQEKNEEAFQIMQIAFGNMSSSLPVAVAYANAAKRVGNPDEARRITGQIREAIKQQGVPEEQVADLLQALSHIEG